MSSKYSKLPEKTLRIKLEKMDRTLLSDILIDRIEFILANYDQEMAASLAFEAETDIANSKKIQKAKEDEEKRLAAEEKAKEDAERAAELSNEEKKEFNRIIEYADFTAVKNAFGVFKKDENENPLFSSLNDQFHDHMKTVNNLKYMRAVSIEEPIFDEDMSFKFLNTNTGYPQSFEGYEGVFFICFRLFVDPDTKQCKYESLWIINSDDDLENTIIPFDYKYFIWEGVPESERYKFICEFLKLTPGVDENYKSECYFR